MPQGNFPVAAFFSLADMTYPIGDHLVHRPPGPPESHDLFGLGIVGQILHGD